MADREHFCKNPSHCEGGQNASEANRLLFIGSIMLDMVYLVDKVPSAGSGVIANGYRLSLGGCAFNSTQAARKLGASAFLMAPLGKGPAADYLRACLDEAGLEAWVPPCDEDNGTALCLLDAEAERTMITLRGIERKFEDSWFQGFDTSAFSAACVAGYEMEGKPAEPILSFLEANKHMQVYFAPGPRVMHVEDEIVKRLNVLHAIWHLNETEALAYTGCRTPREAAAAICSLCGNAVIITLGSRGSLCFDGKEYTSAPSPRIVAIDTIGAGDGHLGACMALRSQGLSWSETLEGANRMSASICQIEGSYIR